MATKPFSLGVVVGRFQTIHSGHEEILHKGIALCDALLILVGSAQESGTEKNPYSYELRERMLRAVFGAEPLIYPLPDIGVGNNSHWGSYVLGKTVEYVGREPDLLISGKEERRVEWFDSVQGLRIAELYLPKTDPISASQMREYLLQDEEDCWRAQSNEKLWPLYKLMRRQVLAAMGNTDTASL